MAAQAETPMPLDAMSAWGRRVKRATDVVCSAVALVALSPVFAAIAVALKAQRNGAVLFRQERIGLGGRPFTIYKFRTLSTVAEDEGPRLVARGADAGSTPVERFLRGTHLDELPQLWNVLRGDMSIVGPRPERRYFIDKIVAAGGDYRPIYLMRPGLTSEATLYNGYTDTMEKMLRRLDMDTRYLRTRSLLGDLGIAAKTVASLLAGRKI